MPGCWVTGPGLPNLKHCQLPPRSVPEASERILDGRAQPGCRAGDPGQTLHQEAPATSIGVGQIGTERQAPTTDERPGESRSWLVFWKVLASPHVSAQRQVCAVWPVGYDALPLTAQEPSRQGRDCCDAPRLPSGLRVLSSICSDAIGTWPALSAPSGAALAALSPWTYVMTPSRGQSASRGVCRRGKRKAWPLRRSSGQLWKTLQALESSTTTP